MAKIKHKGAEYEIPDGSTPEQTLQSLAGAIPELANATLKKDGDDFVAQVNVGRKG